MGIFWNNMLTSRLRLLALELPTVWTAFIQNFVFIDEALLCQTALQFVNVWHKIVLSSQFDEFPHLIPMMISAASCLVKKNQYFFAMYYF